MSNRKLIRVIALILAGLMAAGTFAALINILVGP